MAINMSLGGLYGPHDGSAPAEQYLSNLMGPAGRVLCIAIGNSGGQTIHAFSTLVQETGDGSNLDDTPVMVFWAYPVQGMNIGVSVVELWYPAGQNVQWRVVWPIQGSRQAGPWLGTTTSTQQATIASGPLQNVQLEMHSEIPYNDGRNVVNYGYVVVQSPQAGPFLGGYPFFIQLKGAGVPVHAWHIMRDMGAFVPAQVFIDSQVTPPAKLIEPDDNYTAATPGTAGKVITVGSYVTKVNWTDIDGALQTQPFATLGAISGFSSKGPRRDGASTVEQQKPDVTAPGEAVISALSSVLTQRPRSDIERDGVHQKMQGTSMSSPMVTGLCALMLSKNSSLTNEQVKTILRTTARDAGPAGWDGTWGAGKIDAVAALNAVQGGQRTPGDVNNDGVVDSRDAIKVLRHIGGQETLTGDDLAAANINGDGAVDNADVDAILGKAVGL
ncbi:S8 family serine peptidase [bacterium]|nr:S8 family serine peptidase [bacterium]